MFAPAVCRRAHNARCLTELFTKNSFAKVAELVDAPASGAGDRMVVEVRVLFWAPFVLIRTFQNIAEMAEFCHS